MKWDLPLYVEINGQKHNIRNKCDYRVVLDVICALNDVDLTDEEKIKCALYIFYEDISKISDYEIAIQEMFKIINGGEEQETNYDQSPPLMDWQHDFSHIAPPISRVLGYDVRTPDRYCHFWTFLGAYLEIGGDCPFATIVSIRSKKAKGKKMEKWEEEYYRENRKAIDLPVNLTAEEIEFLNSDW
jgi:hypothetical protein